MVATGQLTCDQVTAQQKKTRRLHHIGKKAGEFLGFSTVILFYHFKIHLMKDVPFPGLYSFMTFTSLV